MPENDQSDSRPRVVVVGGGYAGLTAVIALAKTGKFELVLVDEGSSFQNVILLHRSVHSPLPRFETPFADLARKHKFKFIRGRALLGAEDLHGARDTSRLRIVEYGGESERELIFYRLVVATGSRGRSLKIENDGSARTTDLEEIKSRGAKSLIDHVLGLPAEERDLAVVGSGATGIQFLFEIIEYLRSIKEPCRFHLVTMEDRLLGAFPRAFHTYAERRALERNVDIHYGARVDSIREGTLRLSGLTDDARVSVPARTVFLFAGVQAHPDTLRADAHGRLRLDAQATDNIYVAGDCSVLEGHGLNGMTAQAAVRKARVCAANIEAELEGRAPESYVYRELGYFVGMGPYDGVGWMLSQMAVLTGLPAFVIKEAIEAQFNLYLEGLDLYFNPWPFA